VCISGVCRGKNSLLKMTTVDLAVADISNAPSFSDLALKIYTRYKAKLGL